MSFIFIWLGVLAGILAICGAGRAMVVLNLEERFAFLLLTTLLAAMIWVWRFM